MVLNPKSHTSSGTRLRSSKHDVILPPRFRKPSVAFCAWLEKHYVTSDDAFLITRKAQQLFIAGRKEPAARKRGITFSNWLKRKFDLDDFSSMVITRKAEETFYSTPSKPLASLADEWVKPIMQRVKEGAAHLKKHGFPVVITERQLKGALRAYDAAINNYDTLMDGVKDPQKNTPAENRELASYRRLLRTLESEKRALEQLR